MKRCSYCGKRFENGETVCPIDLNPIVEEKAKPLPTTRFAFKHANDYSSEELKQFQDIVAVGLQQNQQSRNQQARYAHPLLGVMCLGIFALFIGSVVEVVPVWLFVFGFSCVGGGVFGVMIASFYSPAIRVLKCPACERDQNLFPIGEYCPECGSTSYEQKGWLGFPFCEVCKKHLRERKRRNFKYCYCTRCGVYLSAKDIYPWA